MKRPTKGYLGQEVALFPTMLNVSEPSTSPSRITFSPSHSPDHTTEPSPEPSIEPSPDHTTAVVAHSKEKSSSFSHIDKDPNVFLAQDEGVEWFQDNAEKGNSKVSIAGATKGTANEVLVVTTAEVNISTIGRTVTYRRRSEEKRTRKDKGKAIMTEPEPKKKSKKELEQERLSLAEAIRLQEQMDEAQKAQIARDEEIARQ
ncbi:hypothetical protein Tco_0732219 [Tanacetum coccineum]